MHLLSKHLNKKAQRALGRSPEEKVKGHSEAIYRGPLDDAIYPNMKALGLVVSDKIFENCILKTYFLTL